MPRTPNRFGGGARTNANGLYFEQTISLDAALIDAGYIIRGVEVFNENSQIGLSVQKHDFYKYFLELNRIDFTRYNSKKWLPDECFVNLETNMVYIIEILRKKNTKSSVIQQVLTLNISMSLTIGLCIVFIETPSNTLKMLDAITSIMKYRQIFQDCRKVNTVMLVLGKEDKIILNMMIYTMTFY